MRIGKETGLNPTIPLCPYCGEGKIRSFLPDTRVKNGPGRMVILMDKCRCIFDWKAISNPVTNVRKGNRARRSQPGNKRTIRHTPSGKRGVH